MLWIFITRLMSCTIYKLVKLFDYCSYFQTTFNNPQLLQLGKASQTFNMLHRLTNNLQNLKIWKVVQTDHAWITRKEQLEGEAREPLLSHSIECDSIAGTLSKQTKSPYQVQSNNHLKYTHYTNKFLKLWHEVSKVVWTRKAEGMNI